MKKTSTVFRWLSVLVMTTGYLVGPAWAQVARPNVVIVLADDLGIGDLGCYNPGSRIPTPNADRLAAEGMRFSDAHSPSAVCTPTRYGLLTGRYAWRTRMKSWVLNGYSRSLIKPGRGTIASMLAGVGYHTAVVGKWHLGLGEFDVEQPGLRTDYAGAIGGGPLAAGFDQAIIFPASLDMPPYVFVQDDRVGEPLTGETPGSTRRWAGGGGFWRKGPAGESFDFYACLPQLTDEAVRVVREGAAREEPFFLYFPMTGPHTPWMPTEEWRGKSEAGWYGDFVAQCDASLGRVLDAIDEAGVAGETIVVFTSDNGSHWRPEDEREFGHFANLEYRGMKADVYEAGHRVPMVVRWPGVTSGDSETGALVGLHDLHATIAEIVGAGVREGDAPDSVSFVGVLRGEEGGRTSVVHHSGDGMYSIRRGEWKLIEGQGSGGFTSPRRRDPDDGEAVGQLYNLVNDAAETTNLWLEESEVVEELLRQLDGIREQG